MDSAGRAGWMHADLEVARSDACGHGRCRCRRSGDDRHRHRSDTDALLERSSRQRVEWFGNIHERQWSVVLSGRTIAGECFESGLSEDRRLQLVAAQQMFAEFDGLHCHHHPATKRGHGPGVRGCLDESVRGIRFDRGRTSGAAAMLTREDSSTLQRAVVLAERIAKRSLGSLVSATPGGCALEFRREGPGGNHLQKSASIGRRTCDRSISTVVSGGSGPHRIESRVARNRPSSPIGTPSSMASMIGESVGSVLYFPLCIIQCLDHLVRRVGGRLPWFLQRIIRTPDREQWNTGLPYLEHEVPSIGVS